VRARNASIHGKRLAAPIENTSKLYRSEGNKDSLTDVAGMFDFREKGVKVDPREGKLRGYCLLHLVLFLCVCGSFLYIDDIHLRLVWVLVNGRLF
jgi:hypothetical protein